MGSHLGTGRRVGRVLALFLGVGVALGVGPATPLPASAAGCLLPPVIRAGQQLVYPIGGIDPGEWNLHVVVATRSDGRTRRFSGRGGTDPDGQGWLEIRFGRADVGSWRYTYRVTGSTIASFVCHGRFRIVASTTLPPTTVDARVTPAGFQEWAASVRPILPFLAGLGAFALVLRRRRRARSP